MSVREPTLITATTSAAAVTLPSQYNNQQFNVPVSVWAEDGVTPFKYSSKEGGTYAIIPAGMAFNDGAVTPDDDGTLLWVKTESGTADLAVQTAENRNRQR